MSAKQFIPAVVGLVVGVVLFFSGAPHLAAISMLIGATVMMLVKP